MVDPSPNTVSAGYAAVLLLAAALSGGVIVALINKLANWGTGRAKAEVVEIHARSIKLESESQQISSGMLIEALEKIRELVEINCELQDQVTETSRVRDNFEFELKRVAEELAQVKLRSQLREYFIEELEAANKLGVKLKDLPPKDKRLPPDVIDDAVV